MPRDTSLTETSTTDNAILGLLGLGERSGYDLVQLAERSIVYLWTPSRSQIYKTLPRLQKRGLVRMRTVRQSSRPDKSVYRITPRGLDVIEAWLREVPSDSDTDADLFPLKLFFGDLVPSEVSLRLLSAYRAFLENRIERFQQMQRSPDDVDHAFPQFVLNRAVDRIGVTLEWVGQVEEWVTTRARPKGSSSRRTRARPEGKPAGSREGGRKRGEGRARQKSA